MLPVFHRPSRESILWALPLGVSLAFCLVAPLVDHYNDDWTQRLMLDGRAPGYDANPLRLFEFTHSPEHTAELIDRGPLPWWTSPSLRLRFLRPLSSLLLALDHRVFGASPLGAHLHSVAWFALVLWLSARLLRTLLPGRAGLLATWVVALSPHTVNGVLWPSARNGLSVAACVFGALWLQARAQTRGRASPRAAVAGLFVLGLGFGELAIGFVPLWLALDWALGERRAWRRRLLSVPPLLGAAYLAMYTLLGYGAGGSGLYLDPVRDFPVALRELPLRAGALVFDGLFAIPAELYLMAPAARAPVAAVAFVALGAILAWLRARVSRGDRAARVALALLVGSLVAAAPGLFGIPGGRLLSVGIVGFGAALGVIGDAALTARVRHRAAWAVLVALVVVRGGLASIVRAGFSAQILTASRAERHLATDHAIRCPKRSSYALVDGTDPALGMYAGAALSTLDPALSGPFRTLSMPLGALLLTRSGERSITLEPEGPGALTDSLFSEVFRSPREPFTAGATLRQGDLTIRVHSVREGRPRRVEFTFDAPFEGGASCLLRWQGGKVRSFDPPPLGATMRLPRELGPFGL